MNITIQDEKKSDLVLQLILTSLNPLQVSIEKAKLKFKDKDYEFLWRYCYITGTASLLSGYAYLGLSLPDVKEELEREILIIKKEVLTELANKYYSLNKTFPWEKVDSFLKNDNIEELVQMSKSINDTISDIEYNARREKEKKISILEQTVADLRYDISNIWDRETLDILYDAEKEDKYRYTVLELIEKQLQKI